MQKKKVICVVGPTASGKTALAIRLAKLLDGEIISADSMQVYRGMDIGTAKPSEEEKEGIVHHMLDVASPKENYSVARYVEEATPVAEEVLSRGKVPIIAGGTGLYVDSLVRGTNFANDIGSEEHRKKLFALYEEKGAEELHRILYEVDTDAAERIHKNNVKRVVRALEVFYSTGETISEHDRKTKLRENRYDALYIGLAFENRDILYNRIDRRVDAMMENGLCDEVRRLLSEGVPSGATSMQAIGYKELASHLAGECSLDDAVQAIKQATRNYAKRQITWFKRNENTHWIFADKTENVFSVLQTSIDFSSFRNI